MGAAMIIHRHYEKLENEDEKGRPSPAGSIIVVPDDDQAQGSDMGQVQVTFERCCERKGNKIVCLCLCISTVCH